MGYYGPYQVYKIEGLEAVARLSDWDKLNISVNNAAATAEGNAKAYADTKDTTNRSAWAAADAATLAEAKTYADGKDTSNRSAWDAADTAKLAEAKAYTDEQAALFTPLSRGVLANGTDLNTLNSAVHVGDYSILSTNTYPNAPALTGAAVLEVRRASGNALSVVHRITAGAIMVWREAVDVTAGAWSAWVQAETTTGSAQVLTDAKTYTDGKVATDRGRLDAIEAKQAVKAVRLEAGKWVWDRVGGTHYVIPDHTGALIVRPTPWPVPTTTPALDW